MIPLLDLTRQPPSLRRRIRQRFQRVLESGKFILGEEVAQFEQEFARFCGTRYGVGVASGSDALELSLRALGIGPGDWVATVSFTFLATVDAILHVGARPFFIDIDPVTYTMDPHDLFRRISRLPARLRRRVKAVIPVHLFGHPCRMDSLFEVARRYGLAVVEDAAQAAGARWDNRPVGSFGDLGCFSFFPSKILGGLGDGGMVVTDSFRLYQRLRLLRVHGRKGQVQVALGRNSRLDELQAALLRTKLEFLRAWIEKRRRLADAYTRHLSKTDGVQCPEAYPKATHAFCLYVIRVRDRGSLRKRLERAGIATGVYYSIPVHRQPILRQTFGDLRLPETERAAREVLALPLFPELRLREVRRVAQVVQEELDDRLRKGARA